MGHWSDQGFIANPLSYYKSEIQQIFVDAFGSDFDLNDNLPQGVLIQRLAELFYGIDMDGIEAFSRLNLNTMGGLFLDVVGNLRGITRRLGTPQTGVVSVTCRAENFIPFSFPEGTVFTVVETGDRFVTTGLTTLSSNVASIEVAYSEDGNSSAIIGNTMTVEGYPQVQNIEIISLFDGTDRESDISYRSRLQKEYPAAVGTMEYVTNKIRALASVKAVGFLYNDTDTTVDTIPAYCTEWIVAPKAEVRADALGVMKADVASVIINSKVPGSPTYGNTSVVTQDVFGTQKTVNFTIAEEIPIEISVTVGTPEATGVFDLSGISEIKIAVGDYVNNLDIGKDVSYSRCIAPFAASEGFDVLSFKMRTVNGIIGVDTKTYIRNPLYDTETAWAWRIGDDLTPYYTSGDFFPLVGDSIFSDAECTDEVTTIDSIDEHAWQTNANLLIDGRQYASITPENIKVNV